MPAITQLSVALRRPAINMAVCGDELAHATPFVIREPETPCDQPLQNPPGTPLPSHCSGSLRLRRKATISSTRLAQETKASSFWRGLRRLLRPLGRMCLSNQARFGRLQSKTERILFKARGVSSSWRVIYKGPYHCFALLLGTSDVSRGNKREHCAARGLSQSVSESVSDRMGKPISPVQFQLRDLELLKGIQTHVMGSTPPNGFTGVLSWWTPAAIIPVGPIDISLPGSRRSRQAGWLSGQKQTLRVFTSDI